MGFAPAVKRVLARLPQRRQSLLFSATMPHEIRSLAASFLRDPLHVEVSPVSSTAERIDQRVCLVERGNKHPLLVHLLKTHSQGLALVFTRTKHGANKLAKNLCRDGVPSDAIHGNKSQSARQRALDDFRTGALRVLVATDIAARGIDVKGIDLVVNFDIPNEPESYVHRIGRTARAGAEGLAISLCDDTERGFLRDIQRLIRKQIPIMEHTFTQSVPMVHEAARSGRPSAPVAHFAQARRPQGQSHSHSHSHSRPNQGHAPQAARPAMAAAGGVPAGAPMARPASAGVQQPGAQARRPLWRTTFRSRNGR